MKKMLLLIPFILSICFMFAQVNEYTFVQSNQTYTEITGGTVVITGNVDDTQYAVAPPFNFTFNSTVVTAMAMSTNGYLSFDAGISSFGYAAIGSTTVGTGVAAPMSLDLRGRADGELRWEVLGTAPNRTAVYQWKNWTAYGAAYVGDNWNFQVILYETTNDIAFRYGPFTITSALDETAQVGLRGATNTAFINRTTTTDWNATTQGTTNAATVAITTTIYPANGLQFRFNYPIANTVPNPAIAVAPTNGATNVMSAATLNWASGGGLPTGYRLNFGTNTAANNIVNNMDLGAVNSYDPTPDMALNTTYYWQIVPYNTYGNAVNNPIWSFTTGGAVVLMTNGSQTVADGATYSFYDSGGAAGTYQNNENYTFTFTAASPSSTLDINFTNYNTESGWDFLKIYDGPNATSPQIGPVDGYNGTDGPGAFEAGNAVTFVFTSDVSITYAGWEATVTAVASLPNDLQAVSITGPSGPAQGTSTPYTINIRNRGTVAQSTYTVKLMSGTTVLAQVAGPTIQPGETLPVVINHTFTAQGPVTVFGRVDLAGDQVPLNNDTPPYDLIVQPSGTVLVEIGTGTAAQGYPFYIWYDYTRDASLYTSAEIGVFGAITSVKWYCATPGAMAIPYKIYLKSTTDTALTAAPWATMITDATLMLDATMTFSATGWVTFNFTTPFIYTGGNLLVLVEANIGVYVTGGPTFRYTTSPAGMHQYWAQDDTAPTDNGDLNTNRPNIGIYLVTAGLGHLSGTVTSGTTPLAGATVSINTTAYTTTTSATGTYSLMYIPQGPYTVTVSKVGYQTQSLPVTIVEDQTATLNFNMVSLPQVNVTGLVVGSDAPTIGIADASINLVGMVNYTGTTNATGNFTITGVYASNTYNYTISKAGYSPATGTINVGTTNFNMGTIVLNEVAFPPTGVQAVEAAPNVNITWTAPNPNVQNFEDSFETYTDFAIDFAPWVNVDVDQSATYGFNGFDFPGEYGVMSFMIFNHLTTVPASTTEMGPGHTGDKYVTCWAATTFPNNDWLISPSISVPANGVVKFWARSQTADYGLERFHVGVSTTGTVPADFTIISGATYVQAPIAWTEFTYQLNAYAGQNVRIGIRCVSNDAFVLMLDDFFVGVPAKGLDAPIANVAPIAIHRSGAKVTGNYISNRITERIANAPIIQNYDTRALVGYKVWRLLEGQETNEAAWTSLTPNTITATAYQDINWSNVPDGNYKWAVKAVYTGDVMSTPALSNMVPKLTQIGTIAGLVRNSENQPIANATVSAGTYTATTNASGAYSLLVPAGTYTVTAVANGYVNGTQTGIVVVTGNTTNVNFVLAVSNLVTDGFETYTDFAVDFPPWVNVDVDLSTTYGITGITFLHSGEAMAYIIFNPSATTPPLTTAAYTPHGGAKYAACIAATTPPNNDWLISQQFDNIGTGATVGFWAKSLTATYGLERFKVGLSSGGTAPANFTFISGATYIQAPIEWTYYQYDIPATYVGQSLRFGLQCVSNDAFIFMVDDFVMDLGTTAVVDPVTPVVATVLNGNFPNPFNPETTISYAVKGTSTVTVDIYNSKGQRIKTLVDETKAEGHYSVKWDGTDNNNRKVSSGVYFYKMNAGEYSSSRKMILMK